MVCISGLSPLSDCLGTILEVSKRICGETTGKLVFIAVKKRILIILRGSFGGGFLRFFGSYGPLALGVWWQNSV